MLAAILEQNYGIQATVLYATDELGHIAPNHLTHIPGLKALRDADLLVMFTRFRALPKQQFQEILNYAESGRPMVGFRTATHAFLYKEEPRKQWNDKFSTRYLWAKVDHPPRAQFQHPNRTDPRLPAPRIARGATLRRAVLVVPRGRRRRRPTQRPCAPGERHGRGFQPDRPQTLPHRANRRLGAGARSGWGPDPTGLLHHAWASLRFQTARHAHLGPQRNPVGTRHGCKNPRRGRGLGDGAALCPHPSRIRRRHPRPLSGWGKRTPFCERTGTRHRFSKWRPRDHRGQWLCRTHGHGWGL